MEVVRLRFPGYSDREIKKLAGWLRTSGSQMLSLFPAAYLANSLATSDDPTEAAVKAACKLSWNKKPAGQYSAAEVEAVYLYLLQQDALEPYLQASEWQGGGGGGPGWTRAGDCSPTRGDDTEGGERGEGDEVVLGRWSAMVDEEAPTCEELVERGKELEGERFERFLDEYNWSMHGACSSSLKTDAKPRSRTSSLNRSKSWSCPKRQQAWTSAKKQMAACERERTAARPVDLAAGRPAPSMAAVAKAALLSRRPSSRKSVAVLGTAQILRDVSEDLKMAAMITDCRALSRVEGPIFRHLEVIESVLSHRDDNVDAETETETEAEAEAEGVDVDLPTTAEEPLDLGPSEDGWVPTPTAPGMSAVPVYAKAYAGICHGAGVPVPTGERRQSPQPVSPPASPQEVSPRATGVSDVDAIYLRMSKKLAETERKAALELVPVCGR